MKGHEAAPVSPPMTSLLGTFFRLAAWSPGMAAILRPIARLAVPLVSTAVRDATRKNSTRVFGRRLSRTEHRAYAREVVNSFYNFVVDVAGASNRSPEQLRSLVAHVDGLEAFRANRGAGRGAILVTAHFGSFECGLAALAREERRISVVFRRDADPAFEASRARLHRALGIVEAPIDDGLDTWLSLRDALLHNEVVVMQGDRAAPGQRTQTVPFLFGQLRLPTGPVRLARLTGSPIIPVFTVRQPDGRHRVLLLPAIEPDTPPTDAGDRAPSASLRAIANSIASVVSRYPHQWLVLEPVFVEDLDDGRG